MKSLNVLLATASKPKQVGQLFIHNRQIHFEYNTDFLKSGFSLSPYNLPLSPSSLTDSSGLWQGLHGVFNDSLPDGWGLLLMDRELRKAHISPQGITPLDRLAWLGRRTMGALIYEPCTNRENDPILIELQHLADNARQIFEGSSDEVLPALFRAGGSPGGARPKALIAINDNHMITADGNIPEGYSSWLVKFNAKDDFPDAGNIEYAYSLAAKKAGIDMPETQLLEGKFFATQRFDRTENGRLHVHTLGNMIAADFREPSLDYQDICKVVLDVTKNHGELLKIFRQIVFNVAFHNRDDHSKNFAFIWHETESAWRLSPAYDLMFSLGIYGEHTTTIAGEGKSPSKKDIMHIARDFNIEDQVTKIISDINYIVEYKNEFMEIAHVSRDSQNKLKHYIQPIK